jgi:hypothetical protein
MGYGGGQRVAFAGLVIGFLLCATGCIAPYWQEGHLNLNKFTSFIGKVVPLGDVDLAKMNGGLWWYCYSVLGDSECKAYDFENESGKIVWVIRISSAVNVILALLCSVAALSRTCCCTGGKTIFHGIVAFFAGGAGITAIGLFAANASEGFGMKLKFVEFGWAFYIYIAGTVLVTLVSFMLCFASPDNPLTPMIISSVGGAFPGGRYSRMPDDRMPLEEANRDMHVNINYPGVQSY